MLLPLHTERMPDQPLAADTLLCAILADGFSPLLVRPASLLSYVPIIGTDSPEIDLVDSSTWTINGTLTKTAHTRVVMPWRQAGMVFAPAAAGGRIMSSLAGAGGLAGPGGIAGPGGGLAGA